MKSIENLYIVAISLMTFNFLIFYFINKLDARYFYKLIDKPDKKRKTHLKPTLMIGGIYFALISLIYSITFYIIGELTLTKILITSIVIFFVGIKDDISNLKPYTKLILISLIFLFLIYFENNLILKELFLNSINRLIVLEKFSLLITILCLLLLINAFNLIDGINGLAVGISIIWCLYLFIISNYNFAFFFIPFLIIQFLIFYCIYKGKFFLGDNGSLILGSIVGLLIIYIYNNQFISKDYTIFVEDIVILLLLPGLDMFRLFVVRIGEGKSPFSGDRNHLHHMLINKFSLNKSLFIYFIIILIVNSMNFFLIIPSYQLIIFFILFYLLLIFYLKRN
jgi:UDP-GlcNAc:undecaprenyl-phosphate GlcNAc-1-phosphate transferase